MNQLFKKSSRFAASVVAFCFVSTLVASPAYSRNRYSYRNHHGPHHVRVVRDTGILPALLATGIIAGITFSLIDSAANPPVPEYRAAARTYAPVFIPDQHAPSVPNGSVVVTAELLNVRSGPGLEQPLIQQLPYGTVLSVYGGSPGWYYINLPGNRYGWVMAQFTAPLGHSGAG